jgi:hypothetical protein
MRLGRLAVGSHLVASAGVAFVGSGCVLTDDGVDDETHVVDAGLPTPCSASPSTTPFCTSSQGTCPLLADDTITCPAGSVVSQGLATAGALGLASAPGGAGDVVFAATNPAAGASASEYVELGSFDGTGAATFTVDTFPSVALDYEGDESNASLFVLAGAQGAPILLDTIGGPLAVAIGSAASGGTFSVENAVAAPPGSDGWFVGGGAVEPSGAIDVLLQDGATSEVAHRDTGGTWTTSPLPAYDLGSAAIAVDSTGVVYTVGWVSDMTASGMSELEMVVGSAAPVVVSTAAQTDVTPVELTVGQDASGSPLPVAAFGATLTLALPDGKGGFTTLEPQLSIAQPYQDGCGTSLSLGNCSCPQTCSQTGDAIGWVGLVRDTQGDVYVAWLEVDTNMTYPVTLNSTSVGSQMLTCSCNPDLQNGTGDTTGIGLQLERVVTSPSPSTQHRGTIPVPESVTGSLLAADGNGTIQLLVTTTSSGSSALRRVVLDASKLP